MSYKGGKKPVIEHIYADTEVWQCSVCNCWSRQEFIEGDDPSCPLCNSPMNLEIKNIRVE